MEKQKNIFDKLFEVKKAWIKLQRDTEAFNYNYATLNQIQEKLSNVLQEQKLLIIHKILDNQVITSIINLDNIEEKIESKIVMSENIKPQDKGSEITYYRRYNLLSLLDLETEDDDWKKAQDSWAKQKTQNWNTKIAKKWLNYKDFEKIVADGNHTESAIAKAITEWWFTLSGNAKKAVRHYVDTWELKESLFYKK